MENEKIPKCEMCDTDYHEEDNEYLQEDYNSIKDCGKCTACYEEFGDGCADRSF